MSFITTGTPKGLQRQYRHWANFEKKLIYCQNRRNISWNKISNSNEQIENWKKLGVLFLKVKLRYGTTNKDKIINKKVSKYDAIQWTQNYCSRNLNPLGQHRRMTNWFFALNELYAWNIQKVELRHLFSFPLIISYKDYCRYKKQIFPSVPALGFPVVLQTLLSNKTLVQDTQ